MKRGDILKGSKRGRGAAFHFIVFLDGRDSISFIGAVLTHSSRYNDNVLMNEEHFRKSNANGKKYGFNFDSTYLIVKRFIKLQEWGPFKKIGELTKEGIKFVEFKTNHQKPILWDNYKT